ncbi:ATP-binding cassette domain-containing protein [Clostridium senegalense]|uniref:ABC transporter transmembrane domain-containing protein n=1 Tax=Clostridium senegalense TaxID=1465809 RepID=UPI001C1278A1|nr:ABC transporter transmembrane domain-containing protein [Clostridium senegalense]MBU5226154.1 ATP-binding cassette domain-containing protein [Clostridium senegalense]
MKETYSFFKKYYQKRYILIFIYFLTSIGKKICMLAIPYMTKLLIDTIQYNDLLNLKKYTIILVMLMIVFQVFLSINYYIKEFIEISVLSELKRNLIKKSMMLPFSKIKLVSNGEFIQRIFNDTQTVRPLIIQIYTETIINIIYSISICFIMLKLNIFITVILILLIPIFLLICKIYMPHIEIANKAIISEDENLKTLSEETLNGNFDIRVSNAYKYINNKFFNSIKKYNKASLKNAKYNMKYNYIFTTGIMNFSTLLIYCLGGYLVIQKYFTIGTLISFTLYFSRLWDPVEYFMDLPKNLKISKISLSRLNSFINIENENHGTIDILPEFSSLKLENIKFSYDNKIMLNGLDLTINSGDKIGIKGGNGSGKSTLANIISMITPNYDGNGYYNNINFKDINYNKLREKVILIPSNSYIFNDTIIKNITLNNTSKEDFKKFMNKNKLFNLFKNNNIDLDMKISNNDNKISAGEKKIVQILRGLFLNGEIYILDEPLNYIDNKHKSLLIDFIETYLKDKTIIIISHDESIFRCCNKLYYLDNKKLVNEINR